MTTNDQKKREYTQLSKALSLLDIKNYTVIDDKNESPDFILRIENKLIGVEVTELYPSADNINSAKTSSDLPIIVDEALKIYNEGGGPPFLFSIGFNGNVGATNRRRVSSQLGRLLLEQINVLSITGISECFQVDISSTDLFKEGIINQIFVRRINESIAKGFLTSSFDSIVLSKHELDGAIRKKIDLLSKYKERCEFIWLLIVLPAMSFSTDYVLPGSGLFLSRCGFNEIYVLDEYRDEIISINHD